MRRRSCGVRAGARAAIGIAGATTAAFVVLPGCLPSVYIPDRMPMSIHRDASGALTVSFPVCQGDRVSNAGVGAEVAGEFVVLRYGPAPERQKASSVETFVVDDASVAADRLDVPWPLSKTWPEASVPDVNAITTVWARTNVKAAGFDVDTLLPEGQSDWLVTGDRILHDAVPVAMSNYDAKAVVDAFCDK